MLANLPTQNPFPDASASGPSSFGDGTKGIQSPKANSVGGRPPGSSVGHKFTDEPPTRRDDQHASFEKVLDRAAQTTNSKGESKSVPHTDALEPETDRQTAMEYPQDELATDEKPTHSSPAVEKPSVEKPSVEEPIVEVPAVDGIKETQSSEPDVDAVSQSAQVVTDPIALNVSRRQSSTSTNSESVDEIGEGSSTEEESDSLMPTRRDQSRGPFQAGFDHYAKTVSDTVGSDSALTGDPNPTANLDDFAEPTNELAPQTLARTLRATTQEAPVPTTGPLTGSSEGVKSFSIPVMGTGVGASQQVIETLVREVSHGKEGSKSMTLYLHPAELGKLTIQVGWDSETVSAKIITSEIATSELLNRDRNWLIDSLQGNGLGLSSFDVSYGGSDVEREFDQEFDQASNSAFSSSRQKAGASTKLTTEESGNHNLADGTGTVINIVA